MKEVEENIERNSIDLNEEVTRENMVSIMEKHQFNSAEYTAFLESLKKLNTQMTRLMKPTSDGWEPLEGETLDSLRKQYDEVGVNLEKFMNSTANAQDDKTISTRAITDKIGTMLSMDADALRKYNPKNEVVSLPTFLDDSRVHTVGTGYETLRKVGGNMSSRIPMSVIGPDGEEIPGFFTKKEIFDPEGRLETICEASAKKAANPKGNKMLKDFYKMYKQYYLQHPDKTNCPVEPGAKCVAFFLGNMTNDYRKEGRKITTAKIVQEMAKFNNMSVEEVRRLCGAEALQEMKNSMQAIDTNMYVNYSAQIPEHDRVDSRNVAMSTVAELLGINDVICYSQAMKLKTPDGKIVEGTFMASAKGADPNNPPSGPDAIPTNTLDGTEGEGLRQAADLQVLDYICGNVDRHGHNLFYVFDKSRKFAGVQGIDNDTSFGTIVEFKKNTRNMVSPYNMMVLSKETADKILNLKPEQLSFALRGKVSEKAIRAALNRLDVMQQALTFCRNNNKPISYKSEKNTDIKKAINDSIKPNYIRELTGHQWKYLDIKKLTPVREKKVTVKGKQVTKQIAAENIFTEISQTISTMVSRQASRDVKKPDKFGSNNKATTSGIYGQIYAAEKMISLLNKRTMVGRSSDNYRDLQSAADAYADTMNKIFDRMKKSAENVKSGKDVSPEAVFGRYVSRSDMITMKESLQKLRDAAEKYLNDKREELARKKKTPKDYTKARMKLAEQIIKFADSNMTLSPEEEKTLSQNMRKASEKMMMIEKQQKAKNKRAEKNK